MTRDTRGVLVAVAAGMFLLVALILVGRFSAAVIPPPNPSIGGPALSTPITSIDPVDEMEQRLVDLTNEQRTRARLRPLDRDRGLSAVARRHSEDMLRRGFFDHVNPDRQNPADRAARVPGLAAVAIGENIWMWSGSTLPTRNHLVEEAVADWMASPAHRANMLRPGYTRLGVGAAVTRSDVRLTAVFME